ncbi:Rho termination factor N-terminal domain-containing protein [Conexibacter sp. SYSU D00693]|uniref:Rho termination factor N-terminal domain-containing protein n=1 Tax=Conexibacter sp. SYSU D00693 TaxID=2812560 RepID=UPI00196B6335|nr:Rho termination factor N-terminal domain-containing protein [Conexibacter sp. SYSU D00693]
MAVLTREALEASPLADLHVIAREIGIDGFRRLRKADLVDTILERQGGAEEAEADSGADATAEEETPRRRRSRGGRSRRKAADEDGATDEDAGDDEPAETPAAARDEDDEDEAPRSRRRGRRGGRGRDRDEDDRDDRDRDRDRDRDQREERIAEGTVELLGNGSGFLRVSPPEPSDDDVYISAAQVRRCELVSGDTVTGPVRAPRRSERYPSLVRIDTINGKPADEVAEGTPFDELPATWPAERFAFGSEDPTLKAIEWLTPIGKGSRVTVSGAAHSGKTEALRRLAEALAAVEGVEVSLVLAGVRPEELSGWAVEPAAALTFATGPDAQTQAVERAVDTARRVAARGGDAVVLVDSLDGVEARAARKLMASARTIVDGGSLTIIATATAPVGGETTVIALDELLTRTNRLPAVDLVRSGTLRPELLVGDAGAEAIAAARVAALEGES